jgi:hypothetical protein
MIVNVCVLIFKYPTNTQIKSNQIRLLRHKHDHHYTHIKIENWGITNQYGYLFFRHSKQCHEQVRHRSVTYHMTP